MPCLGVNLAGLDSVPRIQIGKPGLKILTQFFLHQDEAKALDNQFLFIAKSALRNQPLHNGSVIRRYFYGHSLPPSHAL